MADWVLKEPRTGPIEVWQGRRRISTHDDVARAKKAAELRMGEDDSLFHEEADGYRTRLKGKRRGWRS